MAAYAPSQKKVGPYALVEKIGSGSFASVYRATNTLPGSHQLDAVVAIKAIEKYRLNAKLQEAIESEIEIMEKIRHKNIVRFFGCVKTKQHIYLVLEYCAGGDLHHYIKRQVTLSAEVARHFMRELAQGLEFLWRHALVHRDLKPHNLLLTSYSPTAQLKIADFGFARHLGEALLAETLCGSPLYMAPEILAHHKYDAKADLWSVGTILYEMLAGKPPFSGGTPGELLQNIQRVELRIPSTADTTPEAVDLLRRLLRRKPTERISFQEFFESGYLAMKTSKAAPEEIRTFSKLENSKMGLLQPVLENSDSSGDDQDDRSPTEFDVGQDDGGPQESPTFLTTPPGQKQVRKTGSPFVSPASGDANLIQQSSKDLPIDDAWEIIEEALMLEKKPAVGTLMVGTAASRPPLPPAQAGKKVALIAIQQTRKHASGRASTFAVQVGERAVHLARLAERIVEVYAEFVEQEPDAACPLDCASAAAAGIVVEAFRLLTLANAAAEDAAEAARRRNRLGGTTALVQELRAWLLACKEKADNLLQAASSSGNIPNPKLVMFKVALGLGRRAAGREMLLGESDDPRPELVTVVEDYSLGLLLLQLLTVNVELSLADRKQVHGYLALFHQRLQALEASVV